MSSSFWESPTVQSNGNGTKYISQNFHESSTGNGKETESKESIQVHIDDWLIKNYNQMLLNQHTMLVVKLCVKLGWILNYPK